MHMSVGLRLDEDSLHEAALAHLARFATTQAGLRRVLNRRVDRWIRAQPDAVAPEQAASAREAVGRVVARLAAAGAIDDAAFAAARAARLARSGHSRAAISAHLAARGIDKTTIGSAAAADPETEFAAALKLASRRRIGPFRAEPADDAARRRELGVLARAGFPRDVALRALATDEETAESVLRRLKEG